MRPRTLQLRFAAVLLVAGGALGCHLQTARGDGDAAPPDADPGLAALEREIARAVDDHRRSRGLDALAWSDAAADLAREHSARMADGSVGFGHAGFARRAKALGEQMPLASAAENVSRHSGRPDEEVAEAALSGWLASDVHRRNLEGPYQLGGVGAARAPDGTVLLTQLLVALREVPPVRAPATGRPSGAPAR